MVISALGVRALHDPTQQCRGSCSLINVGSDFHCLRSFSVCVEAVAHVKCTLPLSHARWHFILIAHVKCSLPLSHVKCTLPLSHAALMRNVFSAAVRPL